mgnify:CR=1 FL=1
MVNYQKLANQYKLKYLKLKRQLGGGNGEFVEKIWVCVMSYVKSARLKAFRTGETMDGLAYWNSIKPLLTVVDDKTPELDTIKWNSNHDEMNTKMHELLSKLDIKEKDSDGKLIESNHFLLQQLNIPKKDEGKASFRRLIQISLNIGQLKSNLKTQKELFPKDVIALAKMYNMTKIESYMEKDQYSKFDFTEQDFVAVLNMLKKLKDNIPLMKK